MKNNKNNNDQNKKIKNSPSWTCRSVQSLKTLLKLTIRHSTEAYDCLLEYAKERGNEIRKQSCTDEYKQSLSG